jgi:predicted metal-dependent phosphoesterase TrpH
MTASSTERSGLLRIDLHAHTRRSADAAMRPRELVDRALDAGLDRIAVTDHGEIEGAFEARAYAPAHVIVGEEIRCRCRTELIGLFLTEWIPPGLPLVETVERIRAQGGLVYAPHPYAYALRPRWHAERSLAVADIVEVFNSRAFYPPWNRRALAAARERGLVQAASSDGHFPHELGRAFTEVPAFDGAADLLRALRDGTPVGAQTASPFIHVASLGLKAARMLAGPARGTAVPVGARPPVEPLASE